MAGDGNMAVVDEQIVDDDQDDTPRDAEPPPPPPINPALAMLSALQANGDDPGKALIGALAGQAGGPNIDMLVKLLGNDEDSLERQREALREEVRAEHAEAIAELGDTAKRLFQEREQARAQIESLAAALGACPVCFGGDLLCDTCHGAGTPGARAPDPIEFNRYVAPAIARVREALRRAAVRRPWAPRPPTPPSSTAVTTAGALR